MYAEAAGFDSLGVGGTHGDAMREASGTIIGGGTPKEQFLGDEVSATGAFNILGQKTKSGMADIGTTGYGCNQLIWRAGRVVPVANKVQPRAYGVLACVYLGIPK